MADQPTTLNRRPDPGKRGRPASTLLGVLGVLALLLSVHAAAFLAYRQWRPFADGAVLPEAPLLQPLAMIGLVAHTVLSRDPKRPQFGARQAITIFEAAIVIVCVIVLLRTPVMDFDDALRIFMASLLASMVLVTVRVAVSSLRAQARAQQQLLDAVTGRG